MLRRKSENFMEILSQSILEIFLKIGHFTMWLLVTLKIERALSKLIKHYKEPVSGKF